MTSVHFQGKPLNITVIQVYAPTTNAKEAEQFYEDLQDLLELTPKKRCPFHHRWLGCKCRNLRVTWSNRQVWCWSTKWSTTKANRVFQEKALVIANTLFQQTTQKMSLHVDITKWSILKSYWLYSLQLKMEKLYTVSKNKTWGWLWLRSWTSYCKIQAQIENRENH